MKATHKLLHKGDVIDLNWNKETQKIQLRSGQWSHDTYSEEWLNKMGYSIKTIKPMYMENK